MPSAAASSIRPRKSRKPPDRPSSQPVSLQQRAEVGDVEADVAALLARRDLQRAALACADAEISRDHAIAPEIERPVQGTEVAILEDDSIELQDKARVLLRLGRGAAGIGLGEILACFQDRTHAAELERAAAQRGLDRPRRPAQPVRRDVGAAEPQLAEHDFLDIIVAIEAHLAGSLVRQPVGMRLEVRRRKLAVPGASFMPIVR